MILTLTSHLNELHDEREGGDFLGLQIGNRDNNKKVNQLLHP